MQEAWAYTRAASACRAATTRTIKPPTACNNFVIFIGNSFNSTARRATRLATGPKDASQGTSQHGRQTRARRRRRPRQRDHATIRTSCGGEPFDLGTRINNHENRAGTRTSGRVTCLTNDITTYSIGVLGSGARRNTGVLTSMAERRWREVLPDYELRRAGGRPAGGPERNAVRQQRVRLGQLAGQRQHAGHVPEPGLHRHVPPRPVRVPALGR